MDIFMTTFEAVAALLFIGIVGFYVISRRVLPENAISILATVAIDISLPALIFANIITSFDPHSMPNWWRLPIYFLLMSVAGFVATSLLTFLMRPKNKNEFAATLFYQNAVFFPIAIISSGEGMQELLVLLFFFTLIFSPLFFTTAPFFFKSSGKRISKTKLVNPILMATILAIGFVFTGLDRFTPEFVIDSLHLVGKMSAPVLMMILGGSIYIDYKQRGKVEIFEIVKFVFAKNIIFPSIMICFIGLVKPSYAMGFMLILQAAVPPITSLPVVASRCGGNSKIINQFMVSSFLASLITIPIFVAIFEKLYTN